MRQFRDQTLDLFGALAVLQAEEPIRSNEIVLELIDCFGCSERTARDALAIFRRGGYVVEERDPRDQRRRLYRASERGRLILAHPNGSLVLRYARRLFTTCPSRALALRQQILKARGELANRLERVEKFLLGPSAPQTTATTPGTSSTGGGGNPSALSNRDAPSDADTPSAGEQATQSERHRLLARAERAATFDLLDRLALPELADAAAVVAFVPKAVEAGFLELRPTELLALVDRPANVPNGLLEQQLLRLHLLLALAEERLPGEQWQQLWLVYQQARLGNADKVATLRPDHPWLQPRQSQVPELNDLLIAQVMLDRHEMNAYKNATRDYVILRQALAACLPQDQIDCLDGELAWLLDSETDQRSAES